MNELTVRESILYLLLDGRQDPLPKASNGARETKEGIVLDSSAEFSSSVTVQGVLTNLSNFTGSLLHDMTTPYAAMTGYLNLLLERIRSVPECLNSEEIASFIKGLRDSQESFESYIARLRLLAEPPMLSFEPVPLREFFQSVIEEQKISERSETLKRKIAFASKVKPGNDIASIDVSYFAMAMQTVLLAVVTATEGRGAIKCSLDRTLSPEPPLLWEAMASQGAPSKKGFLRFSIRDSSGVWAGLDLGQLFLPFRSNAPTSLHDVNRVDMAIAYQIVRAHGGFFRLTELRDGSSWLMVYLPE